MHERKARMAELADGFIALPGGFGTLDEMLEVLTWNQLGLIAKPVVFLDVDGYFAPLFDVLRSGPSRPASSARPPHAGPAGRDASTRPWRIAIAPAPETPHKWIDRDRALD